MLPSANRPGHHSLEHTVVVKYGGNAMGQPRTPDVTLEEVAGLWRAGVPVVLVHGGGPDIDRALRARGIATERIEGLRVTTSETLDVTEGVLCATVNKRIVRAFAGLGVTAVGISGQDGALLVAERERSASGADLGYVGSVVACNPQVVTELLTSGFLPVVAPLAIARDGSHAYNVNADSAAAALAAALHASSFIAITNVPRVLRDPDDPASGIDAMTIDEARAFAGSDACRSSMKPKLFAAADAVAAGASASYVCDAKPGAIAAALAGDATIVR
ncbi:MAG: acetylglutamate kinase [Candidatus Eremiobacteraeota bacterium]|nr:acetylglutamate kinase [Candidatus Eremiobacteraeota bacterium]